MPFVDTHAHLHFPDYDSDRTAVMERIRSAGIDFFINVGTDVESSTESARLAEEFPNIYAAAGIHPHDALKADPQALKAIEDLLQKKRVVAIGEVGLDFFRDHSPRDRQIEVLKAFFEIYRRTGKPLIIHCRDAYSELLDLFLAELKPPYQGVMHCFSSDKPTMKKYVDLGFYISFAGPLTYKKNDVLREACAACPLDRIVVETDAPFLPPQSMRGKRNEPSFLLETAGVAAGLHGLSLEDFGNQTTQNAKRLFGI